MTSVYDAAGGRAGLERLAAAWHERAVADEVVGHAFSHGFHPDHTVRLAAYLGEALGGPPGFTSAYGDETSVVQPVRQVLHDYWRWATFESVNRFEDSEDDVPDGLRIPTWSWDGLVDSALATPSRPAVGPEHG